MCLNVGQLSMLNAFFQYRKWEYLQGKKKKKRVSLKVISSLCTFSTLISLPSINFFLLSQLQQPCWGSITQLRIARASEQFRGLWANFFFFFLQEISFLHTMKGNVNLIQQLCGFYFIFFLFKQRCFSQVISI